MILQISQERSKLLGLYEPIKMTVTNPANDPSKLTVQERTDRAYAMLQKWRAQSDAAREVQPIEEVGEYDGGERI